MTTKREEVLAAFYTLLTAVSGGAVVLRNAVLPEKVPAAGLLILRDGRPGEPEVTLSPLCYHWQHRAEIEIFVRVNSGVESAFDTISAGIGNRIATDRTLGGRC